MMVRVEKVADDFFHWFELSKCGEHMYFSHRSVDKRHLYLNKGYKYKRAEREAANQ